MIEEQQAIDGEPVDSDTVLTLGVCCMAGKASSKPMKAILRRLELSGDFEIIVFDEDLIINKPIEEWPVCQCLIAFASKGFPLDKCIQYCKAVNPIVINSLEAQNTLMDRCAVYRTMTEWGVPCPEYAIIDHSTIQPNGPNVLVETDDGIVYNGHRVNKPFVEKPQDGDRHDIWVYYSVKQGGGANKLMRKEKDKSSEFDAEQKFIRRDGVYTYEPFLPTQGTDIKVYTLGVGYVHAEARKAPTIDGKVERSKDGKEVRYPVVLTQVEKAISALIVKAFKQYVCGFDILRTEGGSIVCDVNGWSFVKGNQKYYNDCGVLLRKFFLESSGRSALARDSLMLLRPGEEDDETNHEQDPGNGGPEEKEQKERLCCALVVMRHGDRRPKEKMKFKSKQQAFLNYFDTPEIAEARVACEKKIGEGTSTSLQIPLRADALENADVPEVTEIKLKTPEEMQKLCEVTAGVAEKLRTEIAATKENERSISMTSGGEDATSTGKTIKDKCEEVEAELRNMELLIEVLEMQDRFSGFERKVQLKVVKWKGKDGDRRAAQVLVVAKWGGELTHAGLMQAEQLGHRLRLQLYPNDPTGLLRLHSSFRHDFKIYSSQEGRCQITAAAFTKGFLDLEGDITPILVSLVTCDSFARGLLDEPIPKKQRDFVKQKIENLLTRMESLSSPEVIALSCPTQLREDLREAARRIGEPQQCLHRLKDLISEYVKTISDSIQKLGEDLTAQELVEAAEGDFKSILHKRKGMVPCGPGPQVPSQTENASKRLWLHLRRKEHRWTKLFYGFAQLRDSSKGYSNENVTYDMSKIPDVWDNVYYDMMTHRKELGEVSCAIGEKIIDLLQPLNAWVCSSEYGISQREKLRIGIDVTWRLIGKILVDLEFMIDDNVGSLTDEAGKMRKSNPSPSAPGSPDGSKEGRQSPDKNESPNYPESPTSSMRSADPHSPHREHTRARCVTPQIRNALYDASDWHPRLAEEVARITGIKATQRVKSRIYVTSASTLHSLINVLWHGNEDGKAKENIVSHESAMITDLNYLTHIIFRCYEREDFDESVPETAPLTPPPTRDRTVERFSPKSRIRRDRKRIQKNEGDPEASPKCGPSDECSLPKRPSELNIRAVAGSASEKSENESTRGVSPEPRSPKNLAESEASSRRAKLQARYRVEISVSPGMQVHKDGILEQWPRGQDHVPENSRIADSQLIADSVPLGKVESFLTEVAREYGAKDEDSSEDCASD